jgi:predicted nucleotidyltransferase
MVRNSDKIPSIDEIKERLSSLFKEEELELILLFGSVASRISHKKSDIDLAFLFDKPLDILTLTNKVIKLLHTDNVDVVDLKRANPLLKFSIAKNGKLLYERSPGLFNEFYSFAFRRYIDTKKLRSAQGETIKNFLEEKGLL